ncbi:MAG: primosomal protein N' [Clostridia bacterium]|nr:primosomal protein N' [Clostridia bacterium]
MSASANDNFEYAAVYLLDNPYCIDGEYDYFIPLTLRGEVCAGSFVTVPFGRGNRKQIAVVSRLHHCPDYSDVKPIESVLSDRAPLDSEILELCLFMKEQYLCTMGEAVRCAVPAAVLGKLSEFYTVTDKAVPTNVSGLSSADLFVYGFIAESKRTPGAVKANFGEGAETSLKKLCDKGYIKKDVVVGATAQASVQKYYSLAVSREECRDILEARHSVKLRSQKHKAILGVLLESEGPVFSDDLCRAAEATGTQIKALLEKGLLCEDIRRVWRDPYKLEEEHLEVPKYKLNAEQQSAADSIKDMICAGKPAAALLFGVTGSGKTGVIISAIDEALAQGRGVIMLLPEIALTPRTIQIFAALYGDTIAVVHSGLSAGERADSYARIKSGEARVVIGTRSAVFSPVWDLGLIVIDEEHEATYKSDTSPKYHARDIARFRCAKNNATMLLSSATPSLESYTKAKEGKYKLLKLTERFGAATLPEVKIYDMRREAASFGNLSPLGTMLKAELREVMDRGEQAVLFLNRRGYNTSISCKSCGEVITCPNCSISLNYHTRRGSFDQGFLFCHQCGHKRAVPRLCESCGSEHLVKTGFGTQRIEQELCELLPDKRILRMDADSTSEKNSTCEILDKFRRGEGDVLLGTQMVTKGHDFPRVTLVGVLLADMSIYMDDYHANERTFSMLTQVIGRAGRADKKGVAVIQTANPDNDTIKLACDQNYEAFYESEIKLRRLLVFPPYCDIALINVTCAEENEALMGAASVREGLNKLLGTEFRDTPMVVFGPFEAPVYKVEGKYRMRIVVKCKLNKRSRELFSRLLVDFGRNNRSRSAMSINFNPTGL